MKKSFLIVLLVCTLFGYAQAQVRQDTTTESSFRAFSPQWEKAQSRFINGDPTVWKQNASPRDVATILGGFGGYGEKGWNESGETIRCKISFGHPKGIYKSKRNVSSSVCVRLEGGP